MISGKTLIARDRKILAHGIKELKSQVDMNEHVRILIPIEQSRRSVTARAKSCRSSDPDI